MTDLRDDELDREDNKFCNNECDDNAKCYCGTRTGLYECICNAGYNGIGGKRGQCQSKYSFYSTSLWFCKM